MKTYGKDFVKRPRSEIVKFSVEKWGDACGKKLPPNPSSVDKFFAFALTVAIQEQNFDFW